jgi:predicted alpha/beta-hydrolase family hydrolase
MLAHGAGTDMRHHFMEDLSQALAANQIATFRYNFPYKEKGGGGGPNGKGVLTATVRSAAEVAASSAPELPLFAGGKSLGGRMTSLASSEAPLPKVKGLVFFGFPLHPAGKPATERAEHLSRVVAPMLFLQGPRDTLATLKLLVPVVKRLGELATLHVVDGADHGFKVLKRSGRTEEDVILELAETVANWIGRRV